MRSGGVSAHRPVVQKLQRVRARSFCPTVAKSIVFWISTNPGPAARCVVGVTFERLRVRPARGRRRPRRRRCDRARGAGPRVVPPRPPAVVRPCARPTPGTASPRATRCRVPAGCDGSFGPTDGSPPSPCAPITAVKKRVDRSNTLRPDSTELNQYRAALSGSTRDDAAAGLGDARQLVNPLPEVGARAAGRQRRTSSRTPRRQTAGGARRPPPHSAGYCAPTRPARSALRDRARGRWRTASPARCAAGRASPLRSRRRSRRRGCASRDAGEASRAGTRRSRCPTSDRAGASASGQ